MTPSSEEQRRERQGRHAIGVGAEILLESPRTDLTPLSPLPASVPLGFSSAQQAPLRLPEAGAYLGLCLALQGKLPPKPGVQPASCSVARVTSPSFPSPTFSPQVCPSSSWRTYLKGGPVSNTFPAWTGGQRAHKGGHALGVQLTLLVHVHNIDLDEFSWRPSPDTEVEP